MEKTGTPAFSAQSPERDHQLEAPADQGAEAEPDGLLHVARGEVFAEDDQGDDHAEVQHPRSDLREAEATGEIHGRREQGRDADERHVRHAERGEHDRLILAGRGEVESQSGADADERQADHPWQYLAKDEIKETEGSQFAVLDGFVREHGHDGRGQRALTEQPAEEIRDLESDDERRADGRGAEHRRGQLVADQAEDARDHRPGGGLRHGLVLARLLGHDLRAGWRACLLRARRGAPGRDPCAALRLPSGRPGCGPSRRPWRLRCRRRRAHTWSRRLRRLG